jgi:hypothetical protein
MSANYYGCLIFSEFNQETQEVSKPSDDVCQQLLESFILKYPNLVITPQDGVFYVRGRAKMEKYYPSVSGSEKLYYFELGGRQIYAKNVVFGDYWKIKDTSICVRNIQHEGAPSLYTYIKCEGPYYMSSCGDNIVFPLSSRCKYSVNFKPIVQEQ